MKSTFLKHFFSPVLFLLVFQGEGRGEVFSGFGKEEQVLTAAKNHVNNLPSEGLALVKLTDAKAIAAQTSSLPPNKMFELIKSYTIGDPSEIDFVGDMNSIQGFYVKAAIDARSVGKMDDVATFYGALEQVRKYRQLEPLKDHIDAVSDLWQDVEKLDLFISDLATNENMLDLFLDAANDATRLNYAGAWEGLFGHQALRTNTVDIETVANYYTRTEKTVDDFVAELFTDPAHIRTWLDDLASNIYRFTFKQIDEYVAFATKQGNQSKVMLGMWDNGGSTGYIAKAGSNHTYFDLGSKWDEAKALVEGGANDWVDEMWEINKKFIDNQRSSGKEFWFSHDPYSPLNDQFFAKEVNYLIDEGVQDFVQVGNLWKAVW